MFTTIAQSKITLNPLLNLVGVGIMKSIYGIIYVIDKIIGPSREEMVDKAVEGLKCEYRFESPDHVRHLIRMQLFGDKG